MTFFNEQLLKQDDITRTPALEKHKIVIQIVIGFFHPRPFPGRLLQPYHGCRTPQLSRFLLVSDIPRPYLVLCIYKAVECQPTTIDN